MVFFPIPEIHKKTAEEIIDLLRQPVALPGSAVWETAMAVIQVRIAEKQQKAAHDALWWARLATISTDGRNCDRTGGAARVSLKKGGHGRYDVVLHVGKPVEAGRIARRRTEAASRPAGAK